MSDFLISFGQAASPRRLLRLLQLPYGEFRREGWTWQFSWGSVALLPELTANGQNVCIQNGAVAGWVGDSPCGARAIQELLHEISDGASSRGNMEETVKLLARSPGVELLRGAQAVLIAAPRFVCVITDPMSAVQVYVARMPDDRIVALGTHPDLVALAGGKTNVIDPVSVAEFINTGTSCWPRTIYRNVTELQGGKIFLVEMHPDGQRKETSQPYWSPPVEESEESRFDELVHEFNRAWRSAVEERCVGNVVGVQLSGGLDSRLVMAAIPQSRECIGLTYCDEINREASLARRVARVYGRKWQPLFRSVEYLAQTAKDAIRFTGCEGEWHHAHAIGFVKDIGAMGFDSIFTGLFMDNNFKGYYARDIRQVRRWRGLLPATYSCESLDYANFLNDLCRRHLTADAQLGIIERRRQFYVHHFARGRQSEWEWLDGHPLTQASDNTGWIVERRLFPLRLPVNDRRLIDLAFRVPALWKAGDRFFARAALEILGVGCRVPNANDGVRPGSGWVARLTYRSVRKAENSFRKALHHLGMRTSVPHSWHDYQAYWRESRFLEALRREHGGNLREFEGSVFVCNPESLLFAKEIPWRIGCRLLQLAVWRSLLKEYSASWLEMARLDSKLCAVAQA